MKNIPTDIQYHVRVLDAAWKAYKHASLHGIAQQHMQTSIINAKVALIQCLNQDVL